MIIQANHGDRHGCDKKILHKCQIKQAIIPKDVIQTKICYPCLLWCQEKSKQKMSAVVNPRRDSKKKRCLVTHLKYGETQCSLPQSSTSTPTLFKKQDIGTKSTTLFWKYVKGVISTKIERKIHVWESGL